MILYLQAFHIYAYLAILDLFLYEKKGFNKNAWYTSQVDYQQMWKAFFIFLHNYALLCVSPAHSFQKNDIDEM